MKTAFIPNPRTQKWMPLLGPWMASRWSLDGTWMASRCAGADKALEVAGSCLKQKALVVSIATGCAGIGFFPTDRLDKAKGNISFRRNCVQVWRKNEPAGQWEWAKKEHGLNGRMFCNVRSPGPTYEKEDSHCISSSGCLGYPTKSSQPPHPRQNRVPILSPVSRTGNL